MQDTTVEYKLRLLMIYAIVYPEKFEGDKATKLMQVIINFYEFYVTTIFPFFYFFTSI